MTLDEYDHIHALRAIEFVGHEREDWRAAVLAACVLAASSGETVDPLKMLRLIQNEDEDVSQVSPDAAHKVATGGRGGDVRRPGGQTESR